MLRWMMGINMIEKIRTEEIKTKKVNMRTLEKRDGDG